MFRNHLFHIQIKVNLHSVGPLKDTDSAIHSSIMRRGLIPEINESFYCLRVVTRWRGHTALATYEHRHTTQWKYPKYLIKSWHAVVAREKKQEDFSRLVEKPCFCSSTAWWHIFMSKSFCRNLFCSGCESMIVKKTPMEIVELCSRLLHYFTDMNLCSA